MVLPLRLFFLISFLSLPGVVRAGIDVDDLMSITWEGLWHQSGFAVPLRKWNQSLKVRLVGDIDSLNRKQIIAAFDEITEAAGLQYSMLDPDDKTENVLVDVVHESPKLGGNMVCATNMMTGNTGIKSASVTVKKPFVYHCMLHELAHLIGISGHPLGRTVLSYFNPPNELTDYDRFIIKVRYSPEMKHGTLPFRILRRIGERYVLSLGSEEERDQARSRIDLFRKSVLEDMKRYALREGEPPLVIFRSGLISKQAAEAGRLPMQYFLAEALFENDLGIVDQAMAADLLRKAAAKKFQPAAWSLARRHENGNGVNADPIKAYAWYVYAATLGNQYAKIRQIQFEEKLARSDLPIYKAAADNLQQSLNEPSGMAIDGAGTVPAASP